MKLKIKNLFIIDKLGFEIFVKWFFFWFLVILFLILIWGDAKPNFAFGFLVPFWKKLDFLLGLTMFFGIIAVLGRKE